MTKSIMKGKIEYKNAQIRKKRWIDLSNVHLKWFKQETYSKYLFTNSIETIELLIDYWEKDE